MHGGIAVETRLLRTQDLGAKMHLFWVPVAQGGSHEAAPSSTACSCPCGSPWKKAVVVGSAVRCQARITGSHSGQEGGPRESGKTIAADARRSSQGKDLHVSDIVINKHGS